MQMHTTLTLAGQGYTQDRDTQEPGLPKTVPRTAPDGGWTHALIWALLNGVPSTQRQKPSVPLSVRPIQW